METGRVALIRYTAPCGARCVGSGLLVDERWVLTADHVAQGSGHRVECDRGAAAVAEVVRSGTPEVDLALLRVGEPVAGLGRLGYARVDRSRVDRVSECAAVGFPRWRKDGDRRKSAQIEGWLPTAEGLESTADAGLRAGWLTLVGDRIPGAPEIPVGTLSDTAPSPWGGMSGAAVVADDLVVGVVRSHNLAAGGQSLTVTPVTAVDQLPGEFRQRFWEALGVADPGSLPVLPGAVEANVLQPTQARAARPYLRQDYGRRTPAEVKPEPRSRESQTQIFSVVDALLRLEAIADEGARREVLRLLPAEIAGAIPHHAVPRVQVLAIVRTCLSYEGGLRELLEAVRAVERDSVGMRELDDTMNNAFPGYLTG